MSGGIIDWSLWERGMAIPLLPTRGDDGVISRVKKEPKTFTCPNCGYKQTFEQAYADGGKYCPNCDAELNIPLAYWGDKR